MNTVQIAKTLDRDIPLEEAVYLSIIALDDAKKGRNILSAYNLASAIQIFQQELAKIEKEYQELS